MPANNNNNACALCGKQSTLRESHIVPKFVSEWLKQTSATGYLRSPGSPNLRVQDGVKQTLLCGECEKRLSVWEGLFARNIFKPYQTHRREETHQQTFVYNEWLRRFAISLAWRTAYINLAAFQERSPLLVPVVEEALSTWARYLLDDQGTPGSYEHHLLFLDEVASAQGIEVPAHLHAYMLRTTDMDLISDSAGKLARVYIKLPGMVFWSTITPTTAEGWQGTLILARGTIATGQLVDDEVFLRFFFQSAAMVAAKMEAMTDAQQERIKESMKRNIVRTKNSETADALRADQQGKKRP